MKSFIIIQAASSSLFLHNQQAQTHLLYLEKAGIYIQIPQFRKDMDFPCGSGSLYN